MSVNTPTVPSAMDSLSQALRAHIIPNQEYLLQGSILDSAVEHLLHRYYIAMNGRYFNIEWMQRFQCHFFVSFRLKGLCDNVDSEPENFQDHEICFSLRMPNQPVNFPQKIQAKIIMSSYFFSFLSESIIVKGKKGSRG